MDPKALFTQNVKVPIKFHCVNGDGRFDCIYGKVFPNLESVEPVFVLLYHLVELVLLILPRVEALVDLILTNHRVVRHNLTPDVLTCSTRESPVTSGHLCSAPKVTFCLVRCFDITSPSQYNAGVTI